MSDLDETDLEILQLLLADARRPYSEIADAVGLSAPAVSDRVSRLQEAGVIRRFTVDVDRTQLGGGVPVLVRIEFGAGREAVRSVRDALLETEAVEHVFTTAAADLVAVARLPDSDVAGWLDGTLAGAELDGPDVDGTVDDVDVTLLSGVDWAPDLDGAEFALSCAECGNTVDSEGVTTRIDGDRYRFCCPSCESRFVDRYDRLEQGAD